MPEKSPGYGPPAGVSRAMPRAGTATTTFTVPSGEKAFNVALDGAPTRSYRTREPVRIVGEIVDWVGHSPEKLKAMRERLEGLRRTGDDDIDD